MKLYVNGDSNSADHGRAWVHKLQQHFACEVVNQAVSGGSNPRILRTVADFLAQTTDDLTDYFFIIGWTSWEREEWLYRDQYWQVNASGLGPVPPELQQRYQEWVGDTSCIAQEHKSKILHDQIWSLHQQLLALKIPHVFFNALMPFQHLVKTNPTLQLDWSSNYIGPYENDLSYFWYLKQQGYSADNFNHYDTPAQQAWADFLITYLKNTQL
jgi:hypothetical protein